MPAFRHRCGSGSIMPAGRRRTAGARDKRANHLAGGGGRQPRGTQSLLQISCEIGRLDGEAIGGVVLDACFARGRSECARSSAAFLLLLLLRVFSARMRWSRRLLMNRNTSRPAAKSAKPISLTLS